MGYGNEPPGRDLGLDRTGKQLGEELELEHGLDREEEKKRSYLPRSTWYVLIPSMDLVAKPYSRRYR